MKELKININLRAWENQCTIKHLNKAQTVQVNIRKHIDQDVRGPCDWSYKFIFEIVSKMKKVENITIISERKLVNFYKILELFENSNIVHIECRSYVSTSRNTKNCAHITEKSEIR